LTPHSSTKSNGERFEEASNQIDDELRRPLQTEKRESFNQVLEASTHPLARKYRTDLREFADLRNAIVHRRGVRRRVLANPTDEATEEIERIAAQFRQPRRLRSLGPQTDLRIFSPDEGLPAALKYMLTSDFSQIVLRGGDRYGVLTHEGLALWLEANIGDDIVSLAEVRLADVLRFETDYTSDFLPIDTTFEAVPQRFADASQRLFCLVFSEHGNPHEKPLRIVTPWDLNQFS
jgi:hypothetical protein